MEGNYHSITICIIEKEIYHRLHKIYAHSIQIFGLLVHQRLSSFFCMNKHLSVHKTWRQWQYSFIFLVYISGSSILGHQTRHRIHGQGQEKGRWWCYHQYCIYGRYNCLGFCFASRFFLQKFMWQFSTSFVDNQCMCTTIHREPLKHY